MTRRISLLFVFLLIMQTITSGISMNAEINSSNKKESLFGDITITDEDGNEINLDDDRSKDIEAQVTVAWNVHSNVQEGETESYALPEKLIVEEEYTEELTDGKKTIGVFDVSTDGQLKISILDNAFINKDLNGQVVFNASVKGTKNEGKLDTGKSQELIDVESDDPSKEKLKNIGDTEGSEDSESDENIDKDKLQSTINSFIQEDNEEKHGFNLKLGEVTDLDGNPFDKESLLNPQEEFKLKIEWNLDDGHNYTTEDTEVFHLPKGIKITEEINGVLKDEDDSSLIVANYKITTDKKVELTFTDYVNEHSNVKGWVEIISKLDEKEVEVENGEAILDPIGEEGEIRIPINLGEREKTIKKKGTPNKKYNADEINWDVTINKHKMSLTNARVIDELPEGTEYKVGSLKVTKLKVDLYGNVLGDAEEIDITGETKEDGKLTIPLGDIKDAYRIEYITTVTDEDKKEFKNEAILQDEKTDDNSAGVTVTINRGEPIKKTAAKSYDPKTGIIEWEIEFNYNQKNLEKVTLKDAWTPEGKLELLEDSLKFQEVTIDEDGNAHNEGEAIALPEGAELVKGENQFEVTGITTDKPYKVIYKTEVKDRVLDSFEVKNTAGFGPHEIKGIGNTEVPQYYGSKSAGTIDYAAKTIDWTIEINHDEYPMEKISVEDTLSEGLTLNKDSIKITVDNELYNEDEHGEYIISGDNPFTIKFPNDFKTEKKIVITYKTDFVADNVPEQNPTNKAAITWTPENGDTSITRVVDGGTKLNDDTKNNHWKNGSYNPGAKEITWTIYTNYRENQIDNLVVKDAPQGNQKILPETVIVKELAIAKNGDITEGEPLDSSVATIENDNTLQVTIGETNKAYKIQYKTSIAGLSDIQKEYVNEAKVLDGEEELSNLEAKVGIAKSDTYGEKSGYQDGKQVHWSVKVNLGQQKISNLKLEDTISNNQEYLVDTIKVYHATVDGKGNATKGDAVSEEQYNLTHTPGEQNFTVEWKNEVERAFIVEYSTLFFEKHGEDVTNTYKVTGDNLIEGGKTEDDGKVTIKQLASGGGSGEAGYLVIDKVDVTYNKPEKKLEGAEFDLIDADTGNVLKTGTTNDQGEIDFGRLLFGKYELHERVVPDGYVTPKEKQIIEINKKYEFGNDETKTKYRVENYEPVFMIELTKTNAHKNTELVPGAEYTVFKDNQGEDVVVTGTTNDSGQILFEHEEFKAGTYYVKETKSPAGFKLDEEFYDVTFDRKQKEPIELNVSNELIPGSANIIKVDADKTDKKLSGAYFEIKDDKDNVVRTIGPTNQEGKLNTGELIPGDYKLVETTAPTGYNLSEAEIAFTIKRSEGTEPSVVTLNNITNKVKSTSVKITKQDSINKNQKLAGVEFTLTKKSGNYDLPQNKEKLTGTTDEKGIVEFEELKPGEYEISETKVPESYGYIPRTDSIPVTIGYGDENGNLDGSVSKSGPIKVTVKNKPLAEIIVLKKDSDDSNAEYPLKGAEFQVIDEDDIVIREETTDEHGKISFTGLPKGEYTLIEKSAPTGYEINEKANEKKFTVSEPKDGNTQTFEYTFENIIKKGSISITKIDEDSKEKLNGVEFTLESISLENSGETYGPEKFVTGEESYDNGEIVIKNLRPGRYILKETNVPENYQKNHIENKPIEFTIGLDDEGNLSDNEDHYNKKEPVKNYKLVDIDVTKIWNDNDNSAEKRPSKIKVDLYQNEEKLEEKTITLDEKGNWKGQFTGLDAVDSNGDKFEYTVKEQDVENYQIQGEMEGNAEDGFVITNVPTTEVVIEKEWKDEGSKGDRPKEIKVEIYRSALASGKDKTKVGETITIRSSDNWKKTVENLPVYDEKGNEYVYSVEEIEVDEKYKQKVPVKKDGNTFTITNVRTGTTDIHVTKEWKDTEETANRPEDGIIIYLFQKLKGEEEYPKEPLKTKTINDSSKDKWEFTFNGLEAFNEDGKAYEYKVEEKNVPGYKTTVSDVDETGNVVITNTRTGTTNVSGEKIWEDDKNIDKDRPEKINVKLLADGDETGDPIDVLEENDWKYEFTGLQKYNDEGAKIKYSVEEVLESEYKYKYTSKVDGFNITNTRKGKTAVKVIKKWLDDNSNDRPDEGIVLQLIQNGEPLGDTVTLNPDNKSDDWEYIFNDLEKYDEKGKEFEYTVEEETVEGYDQLSNEKNANGDIVITNVRSEKTDIEITKKWIDTEETANRPESITVDLFQNKGDQKAHRTGTIKPDNKDSDEWTYTFKDLEKYDEEGRTYNYWLEERTVKGYDVKIGDFKDNSFEITNTRDGVVEIAGEKIWNDDDNKDKDRPEEITVKLLQNKNEIDSKVVTADKDWRYDFGGRPEFNENGETYKYTVEEEMSDEDEERYISTTDDHFNIINTRVGTTSVEGTKTWKDNDSGDRPTKINVQLLANGKKTDSKEVSEDENWIYKFTNLPKYDDKGVEITYTIDEEEVEGYKMKIDGYDITNIRTGKTDIKVEKEWKDDNNATDKRPDQITVELFQNDSKEAVETKVIRNTDNWEYTFKNLDKYDDEGKLYSYTVTESQQVDGYKTVHPVKTDDGFKITNVRSGKTSVDVVKDWNDGNAIEDRPDKITVELVQTDKDGLDNVVKVQDIKPDNKNIWKYTFDELDAFDEEGREYSYTVREQERTTDGYKLESVEETNNGFIITNVATKEIVITKDWLDTEESANRPDSIEVKLSRYTQTENKKEEVGTYTLTTEDKWLKEVKDLPVFDKDGNKYVYDLKEDDVEGYESTVKPTEHGFKVTNLRTGKTSVDITKLWKDETEADRPDTIKVNLLQNGEPYDEYEVTEENNWKLTIADLPKYDDKGKAYKYTVKEHDVPGYESKVSGFEVTNTRSEEKDIEITKTWLDDDSEDRPEAIEVKLYRTIANGHKEKVDSYEITAKDGWSKEVTNLPAFDKDGKAYTYEIEEIEVDGYVTEITGFDITNVRVGKTEIFGEKIWEDENENDRPTEIIVQVKNGDTVIEKQTVTENDNGKWTYTFTDLDKYDDQGKKIHYTIDEVEIANYEKTVKGNNLVNTRTGTTTIEITKTWLDDDSQDRPDSIEVELYRTVSNGDREYVKTYPVKAENGWSLEIKDLPAFNSKGKAFTYEIEEKRIDGYESRIDGFNITNLRVGKTEVSGTKTWLDDNSKDRPQSITVNLLANGKKEQTIELTEKDSWKYSFTDLEQFDENGMEINYTVDEENVDGYEKSIDGYNITNLRVGKITISGEKIWKEADNGKKYRPDSITVNVITDNLCVASTEVGEESNWNYEFKNLPMYDSTGKEIEYKIEEVKVPGYKSEIDGLNIINKQETTEVSGKKTWLDDNSKDRPDVITVQVKNGEEIVDEKEITANDQWEYTFTNLAKYDKKGKEINYTIDEKAVPIGYKKSIQDNNITNTRVGKTDITITKNWDDKYKEDRPDSIKVTLLQNGNSYKEYKITKEDKWKLNITDLPKYDGKGVAYKYSIKEHHVPGYESEVDVYDITNTRIVNDELDYSNEFTIELEANPSTIIGDGKSKTVLTATVKDKNGKPIKGIEVVFDAEKGTFYGDPKKPSKGKNKAVTDKNGKAEILVESEKIESKKSQKIPVTAIVHDKERKLFDEEQIYITFEPGEITGTVIDNDSNKPINGAVVKVYDSDGKLVGKQTTGQDGKYNIAIPKGNVEYIVKITKPVNVGKNTVDVTFTQKSKPGAITGENFETYPSVNTATGVILEKEPNGATNFFNKSAYKDMTMKQIIRDRDGKVHYVESGLKGIIDPETGTYTIDGIEAGEQKLQFGIVRKIGDKEIIVGTIDVEISEDGDIKIGQTLIDPYGVITDKVTGEVIEDVHVKLYYADTERNRRNGNTPGTLVDLPILNDPPFPPANNVNPHYSDELGNYAWMVFPYSDYYIIAEKDGYETYQSPIISVEVEIVRHDFEMQPILEEEDQQEEVDQSQSPTISEDKEIIERKDNEKEPNLAGEDQQEEGQSKVPTTATNMYNIMLVGSIITFAGILLGLFRRKERQ